MNAKDRIKRAARKLFLEKGYTNTTTREIAREAGESLGLIGYYFKSKDGLARLIQEEIVAEIYSDMDYEAIPCNNLIEELFLSNIISQKKLMEDESQVKFLWELIEKDIVPTDATKYSSSLVDKIIEEYRLDVSKEDARIFSMLAKSSENVLTQGKLKGKLDISYLKIIKLTVSTGLLHLGIDKELIEESFNNCIARMDTEKVEALGK